MYRELNMITMLQAAFHLAFSLTINLNADSR